MSTVLVGLGILCIFVLLGVLEKRRNDWALRQIPLRINVNGIRGKSTATRLITSILAEAGYNVVGKTTGTAARMIYGHEREEPIVRKVEGANIKEQLACIAKAAKRGADAMVCECMAVRPEYQVVVHEQMLQANICVIVNILEDHLDVMGPTKKQIAETFAKSIPYYGYCVTVASPYLYILEEECLRRGSQLVVVDESKIPESLIAEFSYEIFPANIALAFGVAQILGIAPDVARRGALLAKPDPGAAQIVRARDNDLVFVNGFAANEPASTWAIWDRMEKKGVTEKGTIVLFNGRMDRIDRTEQFVRDFFPKMPAGTMLFCMGQGLSCVTKAYKAGKFPQLAEYRCFEGTTSALHVLEVLLDERYRGCCVYGIGNIHGGGGTILSGIEFGFDAVIHQERSSLMGFFESHLPRGVRQTHLEGIRKAHGELSAPSLAGASSKKSVGSSDSSSADAGPDLAVSPGAKGRPSRSVGATGVSKASAVRRAKAGNRVSEEVVRTTSSSQLPERVSACSERSR